MKLISYLLIINVFFISCKDKELPVKFLSQLTVIREATANQKPVKLHTDSSSDTILISSSYIEPVSQAKYHIIVASFAQSQKINAEKLVSKLKTKNYPATLIFSAQRYRVSIASFPTESEAITARNKYQTLLNRSDLWIYKSESLKKNSNHKT